MTPEQLAQLKTRLLDILVTKNLQPDNLTWADIEVGINNLTQQEKDRIAASLAGSGDSITSFIQQKLRQNIEAILEPEIEMVLQAGAMPIDLLYKVLL